MKTEISIRLCLYTALGPAGHRLQRGVPMPVHAFDFPDTEEGRRQAEQAQEDLQNYCDKYHVPKKSRK